MDVDEHIATLRLEGARLAAAAGAAGPDAPVPSCPEWVVRDLVRHQGGVHRWATGIVAGPRTEPWNVGLDAVVGAWPDDRELIGWFEEGHTRLVAALVGADPALDCWTFLPAPSPLAMWARRQAHETAVHRVDAELAVGMEPTACAPAAAVDGIDELLTCFVARPGGPLRADPPRTLSVRCTDGPGSWVVHLGADGVTTTAGAGAVMDGPEGPEGPACQVGGAASDIFLALWNRRDLRGLGVGGETDVLTTFRDGLHVRWS